jgi:peptide/nickel transport system substrate-binding protein
MAIFDNIDAPRLLADIMNVKVVVQSTADYNMLLVNAKTPQAAALKDKRVRQALSLAIDRDQIIRVALGGSGRSVFGTIPGLPDDCDATRLPKRDLDKAKALLAQAGASGLSFELIAPTSDQPSVQIAQVVQRTLAEVGVTARVQTLEQGAWVQRLTPATAGAPAQFDVSTNFSTSRGDNWGALATWSTTASAYTVPFQLENPAFNALLDRTRAMPPGQRADSFQQLCAMIADDGNIIPLTTRVNVMAYRSDRLNASILDTEAVGDFARSIAEYSPKV